MKTRTNQPIELFSTDDIEHLSDSVLNELKCGDIITKQTGNMKHTYVVSYKEEKHGICLSYFACGYLETISYDYTDGHWVFNSKDVCLVPEDKTLVLSGVVYDNNYEPQLTNAQLGLIYAKKPNILVCNGVDSGDDEYNNVYVMYNSDEEYISYINYDADVVQTLQIYPNDDSYDCDVVSKTIKTPTTHRITIATTGLYSNYRCMFIITNYKSPMITNFASLKQAIGTNNADIAPYLPTHIHYGDLDDTADHFYYISSFTSSAITLQAIDTSSKSITTSQFSITDDTIVA